MALLLECQFAVDPEGLPDLRQFRAWAEHALDQSGLPDETRTLSLRVVTEEESRVLNQRYRGTDRPTNVLAFPASVSAWPPDEPLPLGEIVICASVIRDEAAEQSKTEAAHWCHMVVHGTLHLAGFDHEQDAAAARMERLEREILAEFGILDPYCDQLAPG